MRVCGKTSLKDCTEGFLREAAQTNCRERERDMYILNDHKGGNQPEQTKQFQLSSTPLQPVCAYLTMQIMGWMHTLSPGFSRLLEKVSGLIFLHVNRTSGWSRVYFRGRNCSMRQMPQKACTKRWRAQRDCSEETQFADGETGSSVPLHMFAISLHTFVVSSDTVG